MKSAAARLAAGLVSWLMAVQPAVVAAQPTTHEPSKAAAGHYRLDQQEGVWWFVDPRGDRFVSLGVNHVAPLFLLADSDRESSIRKYGADLVLPNGRANNRGEAARSFLRESLPRIRSWGFNTLGMHNPVPQAELPYVATFRPFPLDGWPSLKRRYPDPFAARTASLVDEAARRWAAARKDDRLILGVAFSDMPIWKIPARGLHPWIRTLQELEGTAPGKREWVEALKRSYREPAEAARTYGVEAGGWKELAARTEWPPPARPARARRDQQQMLEKIADAWYSLISRAIRRHAPHLVILGDKIVPHRDLADWLVPIVGRHFDVIFLQWYDTAEHQLPRLRELHRATAKPILLGDSSFAFPNERVPNPKGVRVGSQEEVGAAYARYLDAVLAEPYVLGWHYCGYVEGAPDLSRFGPLPERQNGIVRPDGFVYRETTERIAQANSLAEERHARAAPPGSREGVPAAAGAAPDRNEPDAILCETRQEDRYRLSRVGSRVFEMRVRGEGGGAPSKPVSWIVGDDGVVVYDTGSRAAGRLARELIRESTDRPIRHIVFSHHHGTQLAGAPFLVEEGTTIIAHEDLPLALDLRSDLGANYSRLNRIQFNLPRDPPADTRFSYPDVTYSTRKTLRMGDLLVELHHVVGEADDYTIVFMPEERIVFVADLLSGGVPMVASPMKPVRDAVKWKRTLEFVQSLQPRAVLRTASPPICRRELIDEILDTQIAFLGFLHQAVVREINLGNSAEEAARRIELPRELRGSPHLEERYGSLEFAVRGLHHRYSGWFDRNGSSLKPVRGEVRATSFVDQMGGEQAVFARAMELSRKGRLELALEYLDLLLDVGAGARVHLEKGRILDALGDRYRQPILRKMYRGLAKIERERARTVKPPP